MADFGYDVSDHEAIDPVFGDLRVFDRLLAEAHRRGLRVLLDWVPNHTSSEHRWFLESRSSRDSSKRDWYVWRDGRGDGPPNNWVSAFGGPAWTRDEATGQWYLHLFLAEQPDLDWANPEVVEAMHDVLRFWLDRGVDGFRADVIHLIGKDEALPDQPEELAHLDIVGAHEHPRTHALLRDIRRLLDSYPGERVMVGEVPLRAPALLAPYYGVGDELHMVFDFALMHLPWSAEAFAEAILDAERTFAEPGLWPCWVLSNHDQPRHRTRFGGSEERARAAALLLLTLRGTPCLYAGEELGLLDAEVPVEARVDPGGRDGSRAPIPWGATPLHGDRHSILALYTRLLAIRRSSPALELGDWLLVDSPADTFVYERSWEGDARRVAVNFGDRRVQDVAAADGWNVEITTGRGRDGRPWDGSLEPDEAIILTPA